MPNQGPRFSIFTPVHVWNEARREQLYRAIKSVQNQTFGDYEHIIINDGSTMEANIPQDEKIVVINKEHEERVVAFNAGFEKARGKWFAVLDSDDELSPDYLERCDTFIRENPDYKMFNFGCRYVHDGDVKNRGPFKPAKLEVGHEIFGGGTVVSGTYIWNREVYEDLGGFPKSETEIDVPWYRKGPLNMSTPYDFSAYAQNEFPEIQVFFQLKHPDHPAGLPKELGNPWGQDYYLFYKYTRKYHSLPMDEYLYIVHPR